jgi:succinyl-CoA synthetase beta subunit
MKIHEFQAKELFRRFGLAVPEGRECKTVDEALAAYEALGGGLCVVKAQIHAGGRGKGGGVQLVKSAAEAREAAERILGMQLVTHQTGPAGQKVRRLLVEKGSAIEKEYYVGIAIDRELQRPVMMASSEGGMEIEVVAEKSPEKILKAAFSPDGGLPRAEGERLAQGIGIPAALVGQAAEFLTGLAKLFCELDCSLAEINPLVTTKEGAVMALDAKINFDENGLFRHPELAPLRDLDEEDPKETEAKEHDLSYIALDGNIGCMVNGAGLAMSTMDVIQLYGGSPANFLDVGGSASQEAVTAAFQILISDKSVKAVLINIFGGIARTDRIARGVVAAIEELGNVKVPVVVRLEGTNVEEGRRILQEAKFDFIVAEHMAAAAEKVVAAAKGAA